MRYSWFLAYNVVGGVMWSGLFLGVGYFVGNLPIVQQNFSVIVYAIIGVSFIALASVFIGIIRALKKGKKPEGT
jgi:membrane-associated protein